MDFIWTLLCVAIVMSLVGHMLVRTSQQSSPAAKPTPVETPSQES